ncbi:cytosolic glycoprotein FP21 [Pelomyxa schiedti]|nr:cytosolic glycoprotein FP21 [Pelomyxa schiedti]
MATTTPTETPATTEPATTPATAAATTDPATTSTATTSASATPADTKMVKLESSESQVIEVPVEIAKMSVTIKNMLDDLGETNAPIPLPNVTVKILNKVIQYCDYHHKNPSPDDKRDEKERRLDDIAPWDLEYTKVDQETLFQLILAANYLDIKPLLDLTCKTVALMMKGKTPAEIRKTFNILTPTPEEEEEVRKANPWLDEK